MIVKVLRGIGYPGKLWTGDWPKTGAIVDAKIIERTCECCGASTRKLRATPIEISAEGQAALEIPTLFLTAGGVGSISVDPELDCRLTVWNWSHRTGGHAVINPLAVVGGRDDYIGSLPVPARPGFRWVCTYAGSTLTEYLLVVDNDGIEEQPERFLLPLISLEGACPPCRKKQDAVAQTPPRVFSSASIRALLDQIELRAPNCSSRKSRLLALAAQGDEAGMLEMIPECAEWMAENIQWIEPLISVPSSADGVLDTSVALELPSEWREVFRDPATGVAKRHREADAARGQEWACVCASCVLVRA